MKDEIPNSNCLLPFRTTLKHGSPKLVLYTLLIIIITSGIIIIIAFIIFVIRELKREEVSKRMEEQL